MITIIHAELQLIISHNSVTRNVRLSMCKLPMCRKYREVVQLRRDRAFSPPASRERISFGIVSRVSMRQRDNTWLEAYTDGTRLSVTRVSWRLGEVNCIAWGCYEVGYETGRQLTDGEVPLLVSCMIATMGKCWNMVT